jgi:hypothetical protein
MRTEPIQSERPRLPTSDWVFFGALIGVPAIIVMLLVWQPPFVKRYSLSASFESPDRRFEFRLLCVGDDFVGYAEEHRVEIYHRQKKETILAESVSILVDCCGDEGSEGPFTWENRAAFFDAQALRLVDSN